MSDSVDRVFVKAITTIRALSTRSNYGSLPRPPAENRIKLYGLYKQATEGDVDGIMPRPVGFTPEDEGAKKKWDAWKREQGLSKTEAKRRYISFLIETMRVYASGTLEARELLSELEYLWDQIKDIHFESDEENDHAIPLPSRSPSFSHAHSDRYSSMTPSIVPNQQYRNNLQKIYSHSRRSTMVSINDYVQQQRLHQSQAQEHHDHHRGDNTGIAGVGTASIYSLPVAPRVVQATQSLTGNQPVSNPTLEEFKSWQGEVNQVINKLTREVLSSRRELQNRYDSRHEAEEHIEEEEGDELEILKRRALHLLKFLGKNCLSFLKNFSISLIAILFIIWCAKRNVLVDRTLVKEPLGGNKTKKELIIKMVINTDENKWFIRLLTFINSFVGFV
ncbi:acyl CoA binding protein-domain-containing protein [Scheffersomyces xylosifermentans]|uniref:acyl CoA binding protein-domain-containing protein n=1 Tax=Scheffersomyces xylosifermentans TaxID=1304137 RepID=UPI00315C62AC